jgi:transposase
MAYSIDLRQRVINFIESGASKSSASKIYKVGLKTIDRWIFLKKETGNLTPRPYKGGTKSKIQPSELKEYMLKNTDKTLQEMAKEFNVSVSAIYRSLKKMGYVYKKNSFVQRKRSRET